jgi:murein DD-endopeptidase MepM/ murein hydrolase activator NlpD
MAVRLCVASGLAAALLAPTAAHALFPAEVGGRSPLKVVKKASANERFVWPVEDHTVNTHFGGGHNGIDIESVTGDRIVAARSGHVTFAGDDGDGYGVKVVIRHPGGFETLYSHLSKISVSRGPIERGDLVGFVGCTGSCTGDHLHFEILKNGSPTEPLTYLP